MSGDLVPEMHDVGKLVDVSIMGSGHTFENVDWAKYGIDVNTDLPKNRTWEGIIKHHRNDLENLDKDIILLWVADSLAATSSRIIPEKVKWKVGTKAGFGLRDYLQVLWNKKIQSMTIKDQKGLEALIDYIKRPDADYFKKYEQYLSSVPEDKGSPVNITSLLVHSALTSKFYHFLHEYGVFTNITEEIKNNDEVNIGAIYLIKCKIRIAQQFIRAKDLNIFATLSELNDKLRKSEYSKYLLFHTEDTLWFILPKKHYLDGIIKEYVGAGFTLEVDSNEFPVVIKRENGSSEWHPVCDLNPFIKKLKKRVFSELRELDDLKEEYEALLSKKREIEQKIKKSKNEERKGYLNELDNVRARITKLKNMDAHRGEKKTQNRYNDIKSRWERIEDISAHEFIKQKKLPEIIKPPICELCQLAEVKRKGNGEPDPWEKDEIKEHLCETCYENRGAPGDERAEKVHCMNLFRWSTQEEDVNIAWLRVSLDYSILNDTVEDLFSQYVETEGKKSGKSEEEIKKRKSSSLFELRPLVQFDQFTADYHKFLDELGCTLKEATSDNCDWDEAQNRDRVLPNFYILKIEKLSQIKDILKEYSGLIDRYFSKLKEGGVKSPIKLSISCSNIKFAFFWHWKFLENPQADVNVNLVGKGELHLSMKQLDEILDLDLKRLGTASLHKLSKVAEVSRRLSKILLYDKGDWRLYKESDGLRKLVDGGIGFPNILTYAKMMSDLEEEAAK